MMCRSGRCETCRIKAAATRAEQDHGWRLDEYPRFMSTRTIAIAAFILALVILLLWL